MGKTPKGRRRQRARAPGRRRGSAVITADDFGFGLATSAGIIHAHQPGPVSPTTIMVATQAHVKPSLQFLPTAPRLRLGLHLVFTNVSSPALTATPASGLVDAHRQFLTPPQLALRCLSGKIDPTAVFDEICAQADLFQKLVGRAPTHVDGHHHTHQLPIIRQAMLRAMAENILPRLTRRTIEPPGMLAAVSSCRARRLVLNALG